VAEEIMGKNRLGVLPSSGCRQKIQPPSNGFLKDQEISGPSFSSKHSSIAVIGSIGLGDGLLSMTVCYNLKRNGFNVTLFHNPIAELRAWFPEVKVRPFPDRKEDIEGCFSSFDAVISDSHSVLTHAYTVEDYKDLARKYIFVCLGKIHSDLIRDHGEDLTALGPVKAEELKYIAQCSGRIKTFGDETISKLSEMVGFCREKLKLSGVVKDNGITPPADMGLEKKRFAERVLIHPTGTKTKKMWAPRRFIQLAKVLQSEGWNPVFVVSPKERPTWEKILNGRFELPLFPTFHELATFTYESGVLIGGDSGPGHLASNLGLPVLTIVSSSKKRHLPWRPDWGRNVIVYPFFSFSMGSRRVWRSFLSVRRVRKGFYRLCDSNAATQ